MPMNHAGTVATIARHAPGVRAERERVAGE
jgi:hypothetical protein